MALLKEIILLDEKKEEQQKGLDFNTQSDIFNSIQLTKLGQITHPTFKKQSQEKEVSYAK